MHRTRGALGTVAATFRLFFPAAARPMRALAVLLAGSLSGLAAFESKASAEQPSPAETVAASTAQVLLDLRKIVELQASTGWKIDRYEFEAMMPNALMSVCGASDRVRTSVVEEAERAETELGGPVNEAIDANRGRIDGLEALLFAARVARLAREAVVRAPQECPRWIHPNDHIHALQTPVDRWFLAAEGGGQATLQLESGGSAGGSRATLGGGGGGRIFIGRAFGSAWSLRIGPDVSAKALVKRSGDTTSLPLQFQAGLPIVLRLTSISWFTSAEVAPLVLAVEGDRRLRGGGRFGLMIGRSTLQLRGLVPWAGLGAEVEAFPTFDERPTLLNVKGGLRAGVDWML